MIGVPIDSSPLSGFDALAGDGADAAGCACFDDGRGKVGCNQCRNPGGRDTCAVRRDLAQKLVDYKAKLEITVAEKSQKVASEIGPKG